MSITYFVATKRPEHFRTRASENQSVTRSTVVPMYQYANETWCWRLLNDQVTSLKNSPTIHVSLSYRFPTTSRDERSVFDVRYSPRSCSPSSEDGIARNVLRFGGLSRGRSSPSPSIVADCFRTGRMVVPETLVCCEYDGDKIMVTKNRSKLDRL